jgi:cysteine desulfurase/selenocysteine lyase
MLADRSQQRPIFPDGQGVSMLDVISIRSQFPIFDQTLPKGVPVTFLDSAASAQKPWPVIRAESHVYETHYANAYRGV